MNSFGSLFRMSIFGESHGKSVGVLIDRCPVGLPLCEADFEVDLCRRKSDISGITPGEEQKTPNIINGILNGRHDALHSGFRLLWKLL